MSTRKKMHSVEMAKRETDTAWIYFGEPESESGKIVIPKNPRFNAAIEFSMAILAKAIKRPRSKKDRETQEIVRSFFDKSDGLIDFPDRDTTLFLEHHSKFSKKCVESVLRGDSGIFKVAADTIEAMEKTFFEHTDLVFECCKQLVDLVASQSETKRSQELSAEQFSRFLFDARSPALFRLVARLVDGVDPRSRRFKQEYLLRIPAHVRLRISIVQASSTLRKPPSKRQVKEFHEKKFSDSIPDSTLSRELLIMGFGWLPDGRMK